MIALLLALAAPAPVAPAPAPAPAIPAPDPSRLAAARTLIDQIMPPATREQMMKGLMADTVANVRNAFLQDPAFAKAMGDDPRVRAALQRFVDQQTGRSLALAIEGLPAMTEAMARAYARRFDVAQMRELAAFFATPTGRSYVSQSMTIMSDPDIAAWQRALMARSIQNLQADAAAFGREIAALTQGKTAK